MIVNETRDYANSYQSKIFREISALKFQQQHAAQFRYDGLCSETKTEIHCGCFLRNFRTATFENNFGGLEEENDGFRCLLFSRHILSHETIFFLHKFLYSGAFQFWTMSSVFINLRKSLVVQLLPSKF